MALALAMPLPKQSAGQEASLEGEAAAGQATWQEVSQQVAVVFAKAAAAERRGGGREAGCAAAGEGEDDDAERRAPAAFDSPSLRTLPSTAPPSSLATSEASAAGSDGEESTISDEVEAEEAEEAARGEAAGSPAGEELCGSCNGDLQVPLGQCMSGRLDRIEAAADSDIVLGQEQDAAFRGLCKRIVNVFAEAEDSEEEEWW